MKMKLLSAALATALVGVAGATLAQSTTYSTSGATPNGVGTSNATTPGTNTAGAVAVPNAGAATTAPATGTVVVPNATVVVPNSTVGSSSVRCDALTGADRDRCLRDSNAGYATRDDRSRAPGEAVGSARNGGAGSVSPGSPATGMNGSASGSMPPQGTSGAQ